MYNLRPVQLYLLSVAVFTPLANSTYFNCHSSYFRPGFTTRGFYSELSNFLPSTGQSKREIIELGVLGPFGVHCSTFLYICAWLCNSFHSSFEYNQLGRWTDRLNPKTPNTTPDVKRKALILRELLEIKHYNSFVMFSSWHEMRMNPTNYVRDFDQTLFHAVTRLWENDVAKIRASQI